MKKELLSESEIRKFMKFAALGSLSSNFVERLNESALTEVEEEEVVPAEEDPLAADAEMPDAPVDDAGEMDDLAGMEDEGVGEEGAGGAADMLADALDTFLDVVRSLGEEGQKLADAVTVSSEEGEEEELPEEPALDAAAAGEEEMPPEGEEEDLDAMVAEANVELEEDTDVVSEVTRRVAKRLLEAAQARRS